MKKLKARGNRGDLEKVTLLGQTVNGVFGLRMGEHGGVVLVQTC